VHIMYTSRSTLCVCTKYIYACVLYILFSNSPAAADEPRADARAPTEGILGFHSVSIGFALLCAHQRPRYPIINLASTFNYAVKTTGRRSLSAGQDASSRLSQDLLGAERRLTSRKRNRQPDPFSPLLRLATIRRSADRIVPIWKRRWMGVDCDVGWCVVLERFI
jgi:hypothetical protein